MQAIGVRMKVRHSGIIRAWRILASSRSARTWSTGQLRRVRTPDLHSAINIHVSLLSLPAYIEFAELLSAGCRIYKSSIHEIWRKPGAFSTGARRCASRLTFGECGMELAVQTSFDEPMEADEYAIHLDARKLG